MFVILSGRANQALAKKISKNLNTELTPVEFTDFPNQEVRVQIEKPVKDKTVFIFQPLSTPPHDTLFEFMLLVDAARRAKAKKIIGITPWLAYSPQDKVFRDGEPLSSQLVAKLFKTAGVDEIIALDLHSPENSKHLTQAGVKVHNLSALNVFTSHFQKFFKTPQGKKDWLVLCVDKGAKERSKKFSQELGLPLVELKKNRDLATGQVTFADFTQDLTNKNIISFDDFVSTGGSRIKAAAIVKQLGVKTYIDCITHGLLGNDASLNLQKSRIDKIYLTDSYPIPKEKQFKKLTILSCAPLLAQAVKKISAK